MTVTPGIYPMLYTFFDEAGRVDTGAVERQIDAMVACNVHGLAWGGLASEANKLSTQEKANLARTVLSHVDGRLPVSITLTEPTAQGQVEAAARVFDQGAAWVVLQPPHIGRLGEADLIAHYAGIAERVDGPVGIQNAPEYIALSLSHDGIAKLLQTADIAVLKAEGSPTYIAELTVRVADCTVFNGRNGLDLIDDLRLGCRGCIPGPECADVHAAIYNAWTAGEEAGALDTYRMVLPLLRQLMVSVDALLCYGKRLAAARFAIADIHDRLPGMRPHPAGTACVEYWAKSLKAFPSGRRREDA